MMNADARQNKSHLMLISVIMMMGEMEAV